MGSHQVTDDNGSEPHYTPTEAAGMMRDLVEVAEFVLDSFNEFVDDHPDPGSTALGARYMLRQALYDHGSTRGARPEVSAIEDVTRLCVEAMEDRELTNFDDEKGFEAEATPESVAQAVVEKLVATGHLICWPKSHPSFRHVLERKIDRLRVTMARMVLEDPQLARERDVYAEALKAVVTLSRDLIRRPEFERVLDRGELGYWVTGELLEDIREVVEYVSRGRQAVGTDRPYPDFAARRANGTIQDLLDPPVAVPEFRFIDPEEIAAL
jgi:hypothetical protein